MNSTNSKYIEISNIEKSFHSTAVLRGVTASIQKGSIVGLVGPSGGGKSTLLKILGDVISADSGSFSRGNITTEQVSLMFQEGALFDSLSVADNVAFSLVDGKVPLSLLSEDFRLEPIKSVSWILQRVGLYNAAAKMPAQISGGMRRRVSLARALVNKPRLALLDDPTAGLDPVASSVIMELIVELHKESDQTTIIASHDLRRLLPICSEVIALFDGEAVFKGPVDSLYEADELVKQFISCRYDLSTEPGNTRHTND